MSDHEHSKSLLKGFPHEFLHVQMTDRLILILIFVHIENLKIKKVKKKRWSGFSNIIKPINQ